MDRQIINQSIYLTTVDIFPCMQMRSDLNLLCKLWHANFVQNAGFLVMFGFRQTVSACKWGPRRDLRNMQIRRCLKICKLEINSKRILGLPISFSSGFVPRQLAALQYFIRHTICKWAHILQYANENQREPAGYATTTHATNMQMRRIVSPTIGKRDWWRHRLMAPVTSSTGSAPT